MAIFRLSQDTGNTTDALKVWSITFLNCQKLHISDIDSLWNCTLINWGRRMNWGQNQTPVNKVKCRITEMFTGDPSEGQSYTSMHKIIYQLKIILARGCWRMYRPIYWCCQWHKQKIRSIDLPIYSDTTLFWYALSYVVILCFVCGKVQTWMTVRGSMPYIWRNVCFIHISWRLAC